MLSTITLWRYLSQSKARIGVRTRSVTNGIDKRGAKRMWPRLGPAPTYGVLYGISILSHFVISYLGARRLGLRHRVWIVVSICYMLGMTFGAKALYDLQHEEFDLQALCSMKHYLRGGLWGGLLAYLALAAPLAFFLAKRKRAALDLVALSIPIPWMFVKLGCLLNGCCYGKPSSLPWAITFPDGASGAPSGIPLHPAQIYEICIMVGVLVVFKILKREHWKGTMILWFLIFYGLGRAATELFRGDLEQDVHIGPLTLSQILCLVAAGISIIVLYFWSRIHSGDKLDSRTVIC